MRRILPTPSDECTAAQAVGSVERSNGARPWVFTNMVGSVDGAATVEGRSGGLGGPADFEMFRALRAVADVIVVGAATVRGERYRLPRRTDPTTGHLRAAPDPDAPLLCVVSASLQFDDDLPFLQEAAATAAGPSHGRIRPLIVVPETTTAPPSELVASTCDIISVGANRVDLVGLVDALGERGHRRVLCEGGPNLLAQAAALGLVDEWNFTISPLIVGGSSARTVVAQHELLLRLRLDHVVVADDSTLFTRYLRTPDALEGEAPVQTSASSSGNTSS